ncbi:MAG: WD40 repeat domain-containing protein [Byssovorax sp.]
MHIRTIAWLAPLVLGCTSAAAPPPAKPVEMPPIAAEPPRLVLQRRLERSDVGLGESGLAVGCALSPDGQRLAIPSQPVAFWDLSRDELLPRLAGSDDYTLAVAFGSSANDLAVGTLVGLDFWDLGRKQKHSVPDADGTTGYRLAYDGHVVALMNMALGVLSLFHDSDHTRFAHINRNGRWGGAKSGKYPEMSLAGGRLAVPLDSAVEIFDMRDGSLSRSVPVPYIVEAVALSTDGAHLAVALQGSVAIHDLASSGPPRTLSIADVSALSFTPTALLYGTATGDIGAVDPTTLETRGSVAAAHHGRVGCVAARGERAISSADDGGSAIWKMPSASARR